MGSIDTMRVRSVAPVWPPAMRLPASTRRSEIRPVVGARTSVHSRLSCACFNAASADPTWPAASRSVDFLVSNSRSVSDWLRTSGVARCTSREAISSFALARSTSAFACSTAISYGRRSIMNRRSPCFTIWPSLKWMESTKPETLARTSTVSTAVKRPVYSSHSVMTFCNGRATVTGGAGGAAEAAGLLSQPANHNAMTNRELSRNARPIEFVSVSRIDPTGRKVAFYREQTPSMTSVLPHASACVAPYQQLVVSDQQGERFFGPPPLGAQHVAEMWVRQQSRLVRAFPRLLQQGRACQWRPNTEKNSRLLHNIRSCPIWSNLAPLCNIAQEQADRLA